MKRVNEWIERIGADKLLHFLLAAWVVAEAKQMGELAMWITFLLMILLSVVKELWLDDKGDVHDAHYSVAGATISAALFLVMK